MPYVSIESLAALLSLTVLEIALGADNFLHIRRSLDSLHSDTRKKAHSMISILTIVGRILLVVGIVSLLRLPVVYTLCGHIIRLHEIVLGLGASILMIKVAVVDTLRFAVMPNEVNRKQQKHAPLQILIAQIVFLDLILSIDSAITAIAMAEQLWVMISALLAAELMMSKWANTIDAYIQKRSHITTLINVFTIVLATVLILRAAGVAVPMDLLYCILLFIVTIQTTVDLPRYLQRRFGAVSKPKKTAAQKQQAAINQHSFVETSETADSACDDDTPIAASGEFEYQFYTQISPEPG